MEARPPGVKPEEVLTNKGWGAFRFKTILIGESESGKTQLMRKLLRKGFNSTETSTKGFDEEWLRLDAEVNGVMQRFTLNLWDTAGQERHRHNNLLPLFYRDTCICLLVYDISDSKSFEQIRFWMQTFCDENKRDGRPAISLGPNGDFWNVALIGTKSDLGHLREVPRDKALDFAQQHRISFAEITSQDHKGAGEIERILARLAENVFRHMTCPPAYFRSDDWRFCPYVCTPPITLHRPLNQAFLPSGRSTLQINLERPRASQKATDAFVDEGETPVCTGCAQ